MSLSDSPPKSPDPRHVAGGLLGSERRWGPRRVVRLDDLTPDQRRLVLALIEAAKSAMTRPEDEPSAAETLIPTA